MPKSQNLYIYIYIYIERETDRQTDRQTDREKRETYNDSAVVCIK